MSYSIVTEVHFVPSGNAKQDDKFVLSYPSQGKAYLDKKSATIVLPKGIQFNHAEDIANTLMEMGYYSSFAITKAKEKK